MIPTGLAGERDAVKKQRKVFVFGANREGRYGKGAALIARQHHGAIYGQAEGLQGNSYGIITKELRRGFPKVALKEIRIWVDKFLRFARKHPELQFQVSPIGCGLAGFTPEQIAPLFERSPDNVGLPVEFEVVLLENLDL